jgi:hypothetical protein
MAMVRTSTSGSPLTNSHHVYNEVFDLWPEELLKFLSEILKIETKIKGFNVPKKPELPARWHFPSHDIN